jgi:O-acetylhomoserine (thiol)-lyase
VSTAEIRGGHPHQHTGSARPVTVPIYATSAYTFDRHADLRAVFDRRSSDFAYSRSGNPTGAALERRITALDGGAGAIAVASGQAAVAVALLTLLRPGTTVVASQRLYGGTIEFLHDTLADVGVTTVLVDPDDLDEVAAALTEDARVLLVESIANPGADLVDLDALSDLAHARDVAVVVDNTLATPALYRPGAHGADVVVYSATKYLAGHGSTIAGLIVDTGSFDPSRHPARWPQFTRPSRRFGGTVFADETCRGGTAFLGLARAKYVTDLGATLPAHSASAVLQGIETLSLRMERHSRTAAGLAAHLAGLDGVTAVHHPSLPTHRSHDLAARDFAAGTAGVFSIELEGGEPAAAAFLDALRLFTLAVNIGDTRSLAVHPGATTHSHLTEDERLAAGVAPGTVRLSIGLEDLHDLMGDVEQALVAARRAVGAPAVAAA